MTTGMENRSPGVTCELALDGEALTAYVGGRLGEQEAEAFEQHFFSCEECWALVQTANAARASFERELSDDTVASAARPRRRWATLVPAVGLAATLAGVALFGVWRADPTPARGEAFRGVDQTMALEVAVEGAMLRVSWSPVAAAAGYEVRAYDPSGRLLRASEVDGETVAVDLDVGELGGLPSVALLDVVALDGLGQVVLRSQRVALEP